MTVDNIITLARDLTWASSSNIDATQIARYLNIVYHDMENAIVDSVDEDYFWDTFTTDTVADQQEYTLQGWDATTEGIKKILRVEVKYASTDTYRALYDFRTLNWYGYSDDYLQANMSHTDGWYEYRENSIFLYPVPDNAVTDWLVVYAVKDMIDLVAWGAESTVYPDHPELRQYHHIIALWMARYMSIHRDDSDTGKANYYRDLYEAEKVKMITYINGKYANPIEWSLPAREYRY